MAKPVSETFHLQKPVYFTEFDPPSYFVDSQGRRVRIKVERQVSPCYYVIRKGWFPLGNFVVVEGNISTDGSAVVKDVTITYPAGDGWPLEYVSRFKMEMCAEAAVLPRASLSAAF